MAVGTENIHALPMGGEDLMNLFVKTWINDWQWLKQAMLSVQKTCKEDITGLFVLDGGTKAEFTR